jgi:hypothetical protein
MTLPKDTSAIQSEEELHERIEAVRSRSEGASPSGVYATLADHLHKAL